MALFPVHAKTAISYALRESGLLVPQSKPVGSVKFDAKPMALMDTAQESESTRPNFLILNDANLADKGGAVTWNSKTYVDNGWYGQIADTPLLESAGFGDQTWIFHMKFGSTATGNFLAKSSEASGSRTVRINLASSTSMQVLIGDTTGNWVGVNVTLPFAIGANETHTIVVRNRSAVDGVQVLIRDVFLDGIKGTTFTDFTTGRNTEFKDTTDHWNIGSSTKTIYAFGFWRAALTDEVCRRIGLNLYGELFRPANDSPFIVGVEAAAGVTVSPSPLHNVKDQYAAIMAHKLNGVLQ